MNLIALMSGLLLILMNGYLSWLLWRRAVLSTNPRKKTNPWIAAGVVLAKQLFLFASIALGIELFRPEHWQFVLGLIFGLALNLTFYRSFRPHFEC